MRPSQGFPLKQTIGLLRFLYSTYAVVEIPVWYFEPICMFEHYSFQQYLKLFQIFLMLNE